MKIGLTFFPVRQSLLLAMAQRADELGYDSIWAPEHLVFPSKIDSKYPYDLSLAAPLPDTPLFDPLLTLAWVAARTKQIQLGTGIYLLPLRHPVLVAKQVATLDALSGGRMLLGVGAGWLKEEFDTIDAAWQHRGAVMDESIAIMRRLWTEPRIAHEGRFFQFEELGFEPKPARAPVPILIGGETPLALKRAARIGDGWIGLDHTPETAAERVRGLGAMRGDAPPLEISIGPNIAPDLDEVRRFRDAGVDRIVLRAQLFASRDKSLERTLDNLSRFADEVMYPAKADGTRP
jgi:probable F420-dependent oxidoreductase